MQIEPGFRRETPPAESRAPLDRLMRAVGVTAAILARILREESAPVSGVAGTARRNRQVRLAARHATPGVM